MTSTVPGELEALTNQSMIFSIGCSFGLTVQLWDENTAVYFLYLFAISLSRPPLLNLQL